MNFKIIIFIFITLGIMACRKDKLDPENEEDKECYTFDNLPENQFVGYSEGRFQYKAPHFNPNNPNEFIYHYRDNEQDEYQLFKYNLQTHQKTLIVESGKIWRQPKWSSKGWVAFTHTAGYVDHIYIVKDNGDSLIQFTENVANYDPAWSASGEELYWVHSPVLGVPHYFLRQSINDSYADTILQDGDPNEGYSAYNEVSQNNKLVSLTIINNKGHIAVASLYGEPLSFTSIANMYQVFDYPNPSGLCWSNDGKYVYVSIYGDGLYRIEVATSTPELLLPFCQSKRYESISSSPDGKYLIGERVDSYYKTEEDGNPITPSIRENSSIYLIDLQTRAEIKIEL